MPPIQMGPLRPIAAIDNRVSRPVDSPGAGPLRAALARPSLIASDTLDPGAPPVDAERVAQIRRALESGTYPLLPTRTADAVIAVGHLLRNPK